MLEGLLSRNGFRRQACDDLGLHFTFHARPLAVAEIGPAKLVNQQHLFEWWAVDGDVGLLEQMAQVVECHEDFGGTIKIFTVTGFPIQQGLVFEFEVGLVERVGRKKLKVVVNEVKAFLNNEGDLIDLDQEASVVGLAAFIGGEQFSSLFEIFFQDFESIF